MMFWQSEFGNSDFFRTKMLFLSSLNCCLALTGPRNKHILLLLILSLLDWEHLFNPSLVWWNILGTNHEINFSVVKKEFIPKCFTGWSLGNLLLTWVLKSPSMAALWPSQHCSYLNKKNIHWHRYINGQHQCCLHR